MRETWINRAVDDLHIGYREERLQADAPEPILECCLGDERHAEGHQERENAEERIEGELGHLVLGGELRVMAERAEDTLVDLVARDQRTCQGVREPARQR